MKNTNKKPTLIYISLIFCLALSSKVQGHEPHADEATDQIEAHELEMQLSAFDLVAEQSCQKATTAQKNKINQGNDLRKTFQSECIKKTGNPELCAEVERPNPDSKSIFSCTYGANQPHLLINPSQSTWKNAFKAIEIVEKLKAKGFCFAEIYNWWRPEPYNKNVGGAAGRHPFGTSVDVRFCTNKDAIRAFDELCKFKARGEIKAIGYYGSTGVHIGVGDKLANTWGRSCN